MFILKIRICHITCKVINHCIGIINIASKTFSILHREIKMKDLKGSIKLQRTKQTLPYHRNKKRYENVRYIYVCIYICKCICIYIYIYPGRNLLNPVFFPKTIYHWSWVTNKYKVYGACVPLHSF